jgi:hypothetical protein
MTNNNQYPLCAKCGKPLTEVERDMPENPQYFYSTHFSCQQAARETRVAHDTR